MNRKSDIWRLLRCLLYTSDAADDLLCVDLGGRRIIKKKNKKKDKRVRVTTTDSSDQHTTYELS